jgi:predicted dehydrogenase
VSPPTPRRVLMVGLGTIARTHLAVLGTRSDVQVVAGFDPRPTSQPFPVHPTLGEALSAAPDPDLVVIATPTDTHPALVGEVLERTGALVLSEKPLARDLASIRALEAAHPDLSSRVKVAHHFAFSPEVEWARGVALAHPEWGRPTRILSAFNDAYGSFSSERLASYVSTWVDSGPNQLSLLAAFASGWRLVEHDDQGHRSVTVLQHDGGTSVLASNWLAADSSKQTTVEYGGSVQLRMDHTSLTGLVLEDGRIIEHLGYAGTASRKEAHYLGLYDALLSDPGDRRLGVPLAREIAELLELGQRAGAGASELRWSTRRDARSADDAT